MERSSNEKQLPLLERHAKGMQPLWRPDLKKEDACDTPFKLQEDVEHVDTPKISGTTRAREAAHAPWARVRSTSPEGPPHPQASTSQRTSIPVTPRGSSPMNKEAFRQQGVETDCSTSWMRERTPSPELTYSRISGATTPTFTLVPMMMVPPKHVSQQQPHQLQQHPEQPQPQMQPQQPQPQPQPQTYQAGQLIWMVQVPYPGVASALNPFFSVTPCNDASMQHHAPEVGMQEEAQQAGQAGDPEQGMPVALHVDADVTSDAKTGVMLQPSSVSDDADSKNIEFHQLTIPDKNFQADTICKPDQEKENDGMDKSISPGSAGHPYCCAQPCKYVKKQRGCKDGDKCANCHLCVWRSPRRSRAKASTFHR